MQTTTWDSGLCACFRLIARHTGPIYVGTYVVIIKNAIARSEIHEYNKNRSLNYLHGTVVSIPHTPLVHMPDCLPAQTRTYE